MRIKGYLIIISILLIQVIINFYNLEKRVSFGWDQERDAQVEWQIIREGKLTLIGPRAVGPDSFFLGPLWFYILAPFYLAFNMNPLGAAVLGVILEVFTTLTFYLVGKRLFGAKTGILSALFYLPVGTIVVWNPMLIPLFTLILIYLLSNIANGREKVIPLTIFLIGLSLHSHFQAIFFFLPLVFSLWLYNKKRSEYPVKHILIGMILFILTLLPLIFFDLRHNFLNINAFFRLFFGSLNHHTTSFFQHFFREISKFISSIGHLYYDMNLSGIINGLLLLFLASFGLLISNLVKTTKYILFLILLFPPLLFSLYNGILSEYYFTLTLVPIIYGFSIFLVKISNYGLGKVFFYCIILLMIFEKITIFKSSEISTNLYYQKKAVLHIVNQTEDPIFNVSYTTPINADAGFRYLFKLYGKEPQNIPQGHLWTITIPPLASGVKPAVVFGGIGVVRR